jgi:NADH:ubiquinone oxidoreductase subunit 5 (subunit L)/multisubunit Na+/H+ antiporter MnhA subunit
MSNTLKLRIFEWLGVFTAIIYSLVVAANVGAEFIGFTLLLICSALICIWAHLGRHKGILFL